MGGNWLALGAVALVAAAGLVRRGSRVRRYSRRFTIWKGYELYHGTRVEEDFEIPNGPAWFSDSRSVAEEFVDWHEADGPRRILTYKVTTEIPLVLIEDGTDMERLSEWLEEEHGLSLDGGSQEMAENLCQVEIGWHIPYNYSSGSDTLLCDPDRWLELVGVEYLDRRPRGWRK